MNFKFYYKIIVIAAILSFRGLSSFGQKGFFKPVTNAKMDLTKIKNIEKFSVYNLHTSDLRGYLLQAPMEFRDKTAIPLDLEIPMPDGQVEIFHIQESPILSPKIAAEHPEIKTYTGNGTANKKAVIRISLTSDGFNAIILTGDGDAVYFEKLPGTGTETYYNYFAKDGLNTKDFKGGTGGKDFIERPVKKSIKNGQRESATNVLAPTGTELTIFRIAIAGNGEFVQHNGGTKASALNVIIAYMNRLNAFYRNELSVGFTLVSSENLIYLDPATDPFNNDDQNVELEQNQVNTDAVIGSANYDIGHVFGYVGATSGGLASAGLCDNALKAQGCSHEGSPEYITQVINDKLLFHEVGHQFGMNHSYNSSVPVCTSRNAATSVEPGAGITVMSYAQICFGDFAVIGDDYYVYNFPESRALLQFHTTSYQEAITFMNAIPKPYPTGVVVTSTGNTPAVITMPPAYIIPKSTPFTLAGTAIDAQNNTLTYVWDETDTGGDDANPPTTTTLENTAEAPFSRVYAPTATGSRTFPLLSGILDGSNTARADKLSSVSTVIHYNLTVRDNNAAGGGVAFGSTTVTVDGNSGPFVITNDKNAGLLNLIGNKISGSVQTITWDVKGTDLAPINCTLVDIFLSTDGGLTFPSTPLLAATPNIGTALVTLPLTANTQTARIKIAASSSTGIPTVRTSNTLAGTNTPNIFFDISNVDFSITPTPMPVTLASFDVNVSGTNGALLKWETTSETNNSGFDIEMSTNATQFNKVGYVEGKGDSQVSHLYNYTLSNLSGGLYYFRLKQLDFDGKFDYSTIKAILIRNADDVVSIYPNPGNGKMKINPGLHKNEAFSIQILNEKGQKVMTLPSGKQYGNGYELDASFLGAGLYYIKLQGGNFVENLKFVKF